MEIGANLLSLHIETIYRPILSLISVSNHNNIGYSKIHLRLAGKRRQNMIKHYQTQDIPATLHFSTNVHGN